jgi:hypothetical protein
MQTQTRNQMRITHLSGNRHLLLVLGLGWLTTEAAMLNRKRKMVKVGEIPRVLRTWTPRRADRLLWMSTTAHPLYKVSTAITL